MWPTPRKNWGRAGHNGCVGVEAVSERDRRERFERLVVSVYEPLQSYLRRRVDASAADDVLSDVLLVLWRRFDDIPPDATLPWCYGVARGCLANNLRSSRREQRLFRRLAAVTELTTAEPTADPDLDVALAALPEADREVLRLWAWEDLAPREIAVVLGITPNAASIRLHRATKRLKNRLTAGKNDGSGGHLGHRQGKEAPR
jgi:RNA polymerase sigma-70 factor (ECF subfamily)